MAHPSPSPYARALGERISLLDPHTRQYFSGVPEGHVGIGEGVFDRVGTRHRWLIPLMRPFQRRGILVAGWHTDVPFRVENRVIDGCAVAERVLTLHGGEWTMRDAVRLAPTGRVVDELGAPPLVAASFDVHVADGALQLSSRAVGLRIGSMRLRVPGFLAPVIRLREGRDPDGERQRVDLTIDLPLIGRAYEYCGSFTYRIEEDT